MKIVVEEGKAGSTADPSEQRREYEEEFDYDGALQLLRRLRSSGSYIHLEGPNYKIDFRLDPDEAIEVEIMSFIDDFWAMTEISDSDAESILGVAYRGERFSGVIPGSETEWGAWSDGSGLPR